MGTSLLLVSDARSIHTARWANAMADRGWTVTLASPRDAGEQAYRPGVEVVCLVPEGTTAGDSPLAYLKMVPALRKVIARVNPDIVNSHYVTGYALLANAAVAGRRPHLASVWGRDVYDIPAASPKAKLLVQGNLRAATAIASTSRSMAEQTRTLCGARQQIFVTPFGMDLPTFPERGWGEPAEPVRIGTIKTMANKYGIDTLIEAFALVVAAEPGVHLDLYGPGPETEALQALAARTCPEGSYTFHGSIPHDQVPSAMRGLDVYVALSRLDSESFGVAILEASCSGVPVVVSDASGPAEVTEEGVTGFIVPRDNAERAAEKILDLVRDPQLRATMGHAGREHVETQYAWDHCVDLMLDAYAQTIALHRSRGRKH